VCVIVPICSNSCISVRNYLKCFSPIIIMSGSVYKIYCDDLLHCVFCHKCVNLYYAKSHLKTKKCKALRGLLSEGDGDSLYLKFLQEINKLKSMLLLKEDD
jgi:hypothetical protein